MATITVTIVLTQNLPALNGTALDAVLAWIAANVTAKLPASASATIIFSNMQP